MNVSFVPVSYKKIIIFYSEIIESFALEYLKLRKLFNSFRKKNSLFVEDDLGTENKLVYRFIDSVECNSLPGLLLTYTQTVFHSNIL